VGEVGGSSLIIPRSAAVEEGEFFSDGGGELAFFRTVACKGPSEKLEPGKNRRIEGRAGCFGHNGKRLLKEGEGLFLVGMIRRFCEGALGLKKAERGRAGGERGKAVLSIQDEIEIHEDLLLVLLGRVPPNSNLKFGHGGGVEVRKHAASRPEQISCHPEERGQ